MEGALRRNLAAVSRHKWLILALVVGTGAGAAAANQFVPVQYEAHATLWVESARQDAASWGPIRPQLLLSANAWLDLLKSFVVLDAVVLQRRLYVRPGKPSDLALVRELTIGEDDFRPGPYELRVNGAGEWTLIGEGEAVLEAGAVGDSIGASQGFHWRPPPEDLWAGRQVPFRVAAPREVAESLSRRLGARMDATGSFLRLDLAGANPVQATATLNAIAEQYVHVAGELKRGKLEEVTRIIGEQLRLAQNNLRQAENELRDFRVRTITLPLDRATSVTPGLSAARDPIFQTYFDNTLTVEELQREQQQIARALPQAGVGDVNVLTLQSLEYVRASTELSAALDKLVEKRAELRALTGRYTNDYPPVQRLLADMEDLQRRMIPPLADRLMADLRDRERALRQRVDSAAAELRAIPPRAMEEARLTRRVEIASALFSEVQRRHDEARLAIERSTPDVRVLDRAAVPTRPSRNFGGIILALAVVGSAAVGVVIALAHDHIDPRVRYPAEVTNGLGVPILGVLPQLAVRRGTLGGEEFSAALESFRAIRLNVVNACGTAPPLVLAVSSPGSGDGKSFVSSNLALSLASAGNRVVLVDGDTRRGVLHQLWDIERKPGLTDYLAYGLPLNEILRTGAEGVDVIPCGSLLTSAPELLGSPQMRQLIVALRSSYDAVVVDTPPLGATIDGFQLATSTGNLMLVLRTGITNVAMAGVKLDLLGQLPIRLVGAVLNGVPSSTHSGYHYYYSPYSYVPGDYQLLDSGGDA